MIKTRRVIKNDNGDYIGIYGQADGNWVYGADALATILKHKILTVRGEIKNHTNFGVQWFTSETKNTLDSQIRNIILADERVYRITNFNSQLDLSNSEYSAKINVETTEGLLILTL